MRIIQFYWCIYYYYYYYFRTPYRCLNYTPDTLYGESHFLLLLCEQTADRIYSFRKIKTLLSRVAHRGFKLTFIWLRNMDRLTNSVLNYIFRHMLCNMNPLIKLDFCFLVPWIWPVLPIPQLATLFLQFLMPGRAHSFFFSPLNITPPSRPSESYKLK